MKGAKMDIDMHETKRIPIEKFFQDFINSMKECQPEGYSSTADDYEKRLSKAQPLSGIEAFHKAKVDFVDSITAITLKYAKQHLVQAYNDKHTRASGVATAIQSGLRWGIESNYPSLKITESDLKKYRMPPTKNAKIVLLTDQEIDDLRKIPTSNEPFEITRNRIMMVVLALEHGVRSANEMVTLNLDDFNPFDMTLTISRKRRHKQALPLRRQDCDDINNWLEIREKWIQNFEKKNGVVREGRTAFLIKSSPRSIGGKKTWRMSKNEPRNIFDKIKNDLSIADNKIIGTLRHTSCTTQQVNAMAMGYHEKYASTLNDHTEKTERDYYVSILGPEIEILSRFPDENIEFCESIAAHSFKQFLEKPNELRHLACVMSSMEIMGRLQFREMLKKYRLGENEMDKMPVQSKDVKYNRPNVKPEHMKTISKWVKEYGLFALCPWVRK
jgi:site-specific recombinase XerD